MSKKCTNADLIFLKKHIHQTELEFGRFLYSIYPMASQAEIIAGMAVIAKLRDGHIAIDRDDFKAYEGRKYLKIPTKEFDTLSESTLINRAESKSILIFENGLLYLQKNWKYEQELAKWLLQRSKMEVNIPSNSMTFVDSLFKAGTNELDFQRIAVKLALLKQLVVISGGPGTGKTFTVQKIVEAYRHISGPTKVIALAAPTGKAAQRLNDSLGESISTFRLQPATTIHSLLKARGDSGQFAKNVQHPLDVDVLIIDEASMLDISLWVAVIRALPEHAKLIVLGDRFQLASVEAGYILGDICGDSTNTFSKVIQERMGEGVEGMDIATAPDFNDSVITLTKSYRFKEHGGIQELAEAIKNGDHAHALHVLDSRDYPEVGLQEGKVNQQDILNKYVYFPFKKMLPSTQKMKELNSHRILCAMRVGIAGVEQWNIEAERVVRRHESISPQIKWYNGRPIIITKNNAILGIRNGEVGIYDEFSQRVNFETLQKGIPQNSLSNYEPAFCLTVHKSQGSEYDSVAIVLPNFENKLLSKELLYTAVTRARQNVLVIGNRKTVAYSIKNATQRKGGLKKKLWGI